jgi:hypothetical protein
VPVIRIPTTNVAEGGRLIRFRDEQGRERTVPLLRLHLDVLVGRDPTRNSPDERRPRRTILDTGAPLTIFPKDLWQSFADEIVRLPFVGEQGQIGRAGGRQFSYFLGRVWVGVTDPFDRRLPAVPVLAQFREDAIPAGEPLPPILLGLWGGILEGRQLTRWPTAERYDSDMPTLESFGQWWHLSEP